MAAANSAEQSEAFNEAKITILNLSVRTPTHSCLVLRVGPIFWVKLFADGDANACVLPVLARPRCNASCLVLEQKERQQLQKERDEIHNQHAQALLKCDTLVARLEAEIEARNDAEERGGESATSLRAAKVRNTELQDELALTVAKLENGGRREGTDLYSEVDDKRRALEKETITLRHKIKTLQKAVELGDRQRRQLRNQIQMLSMMRGGSRADTEKMRRMENALSQAKSEVMALGAKCLELETLRDDFFARLRAHHDAYSEFGDKRTYVEMLQEEVAQGKGELKRRDEELRTAVMQQMSEGSKLRECELKLYKAEHDLEVLKTANMNLELRIDDLEIQAIAAASAPPPVPEPVEDSNADGDAETAGSEVGEADSPPRSSGESSQEDQPDSGPCMDENGESFTEKVADEEADASPGRRRPLRDTNRSAKAGVEITVDDDKVNGAGECAQQ